MSGTAAGQKRNFLVTKKVPYLVGHADSRTDKDRESKGSGSSLLCDLGRSLPLSRLQPPHLPECSGYRFPTALLLCVL